MQHISVGTKVRIREDLEHLHAYNGVCFSEAMAKYCGQVVTISKEVSGGIYTIHEDNGIFWWTDDMFDLDDNAKETTLKSITPPLPICVAKDAISQISNIAELAYLLDEIQSRLNEATQKDANFLTDTDKMYDFLRIDKDSFLESYLYLTEEEYDNTDRLYHAALCAYFDYMSEKTHMETGIEFHPCFCPKQYNLKFKVGDCVILHDTTHTRVTEATTDEFGVNIYMTEDSGCEWVTEDCLSKDTHPNDTI